MITLVASGLYCTNCGRTNLTIEDFSAQTVAVLLHKEDHWCNGCHYRHIRERKKRRNAVFERDNWICQLCKQPVDKTLTSPDWWSVTEDHIWPKSRGGASELDNLQCAHKICNEMKGSHTGYSVEWGCSVGADGQITYFAMNEMYDGKERESMLSVWIARLTLGLVKL